MQHMEELGEKEAAIATAAIREELSRRGKVGVIAVSDSHGEILSLLRMDGAPLPSVLVATSKVWTAARERSATGALGKAFKENGWQLANSDPRYTGWDGGVPVLHGDRVVGAVAVSGLEQEEDAELARLGAARIAESFTG
jgi:glc operon protein GlcG